MVDKSERRIRTLQDTPRSIGDQKRTEKDSIFSREESETVGENRKDSPVRNGFDSPLSFFDWVPVPGFSGEFVEKNVFSVSKRLNLLSIIWISSGILTLITTIRILI